LIFRPLKFRVLLPCGRVVSSFESFDAMSLHGLHPVRPEVKRRSAVVRASGSRMHSSSIHDQWHLDVAVASVTAAGGARPILSYSAVPSIIRMPGQFAGTFVASGGRNGDGERRFLKRRRMASSTDHRPTFMIAGDRPLETRGEFEQVLALLSPRRGLLRSRNHTDSDRVSAIGAASCGASAFTQPL
jgi:hypothetical protein